jgi:hypothetical protein
MPLASNIIHIFSLSPTDFIFKYDYFKLYFLNSVVYSIKQCFTRQFTHSAEDSLRRLLIKAEYKITNLHTKKRRESKTRFEHANGKLHFIRSGGTVHMYMHRVD